jgi:hypothetical protein
MTWFRRNRSKWHLVHQYDELHKRHVTACTCEPRIGGREEVCITRPTQNVCKFCAGFQPRTGNEARETPEPQGMPIPGQHGGV